MKGHELLIFNMCVSNFKFCIFLVHGATPRGLRMLSYKCIFSIEDILFTALSPPCLFSLLCFSRFVLFLLSYHM